jgi:hypothetical protein
MFCESVKKIVIMNETDIFGLSFDIKKQIINNLDMQSIICLSKISKTNHQTYSNYIKERITNMINALQNNGNTIIYIKYINSMDCEYRVCYSANNSHVLNIDGLNFIKYGNDVSIGYFYIDKYGDIIYCIPTYTKHNTKSK